VATKATQPLAWRGLARGLNETGGWWDEDRTRLSFRLCAGVRRHDGSPFIPKDVQCASDLLTGNRARSCGLILCLAPLGFKEQMRHPAALAGFFARTRVNRARPGRHFCITKI
jgi:hypothetical protein